MRIKLCISIAAFLVSGCTNMKTITQERAEITPSQTGCSHDEIFISDETSYTWTATCKQRKFYCTAAPSFHCSEAK